MLGEEHSLNRLDDMYEVEAIIAHSGTASRQARSLMCQCSPLSVTTSTLQPSRSSRSSASRRRGQRHPYIYLQPSRSSRSSARAIWSRGLLPGSNSTGRSRSLGPVSSPRATDPNIRTLRAPCLVATSTISSLRSIGSARRLTLPVPCTNPMEQGNIRARPACNSHSDCLLPSAYAIIAISIV